MDVAATDNTALERSAYRKASLRILPLIALGYGAAYIDRVNISFASLQMNRDLNFSATVYGFGAGLFFLSYAACAESSATRREWLVPDKLDQRRRESRESQHTCEPVQT